MSFHERWGVSLDSVKKVARGGLPALLDKPNESGRIPSGAKPGSQNRSRTEATAPFNGVAGQVPEGVFGGNFSGGNMMLIAGGLLVAVVLFKLVK